MINLSHKYFVTMNVYFHIFKDHLLEILRLLMQGYFNYIWLIYDKEGNYIMIKRNVYKVIKAFIFQIHLLKKTCKNANKTYLKYFKSLKSSNKFISFYREANRHDVKNYKKSCRSLQIPFIQKKLLFSEHKCSTSI